MSAKTAILSDIHGNSPALKAVLEDVRREGCTEVFVLGDIVNGVDPGGCLDLLAGRGDITFVKGNAEFHLLTPDLNAFPLRGGLEAAASRAPGGPHNRGRQAWRPSPRVLRARATL